MTFLDLDITLYCKFDNILIHFVALVLWNARQPVTYIEVLLVNLSRKMYSVHVLRTEGSKEFRLTTHQEGLVELKQTGELFEQLVNTV